LIQADVSVTRNRLCTELSTEMGEQSIGERQVWSLHQCILSGCRSQGGWFVVLLAN
jgi:hypothetical protein